MLLEQPEVEIYYIVDDTGTDITGIEDSQMHGDLCETHHGVY